MRNVRITIWVMVVAAVFSAINSAQAEDTYWVGTTGDWFHPANWQYKVPEWFDTAYIDNGGTAEIITGDAQAGPLYVGYSTGNSGNITHTGGTLLGGDFLHVYLGYSTNSVGIYDLSGTGQIIDGWRTIGVSGTGIFNQTGGTNSAFSDMIGSGIFIEPSGMYKLSGTGQILMNRELIVHGVFNQSGGTNSVYETYIRYSGEYNLS